MRGWVSVCVGGLVCMGGLVCVGGLVCAWVG